MLLGCKMSNLKVVSPTFGGGATAAPAAYEPEEPDWSLWFMGPVKGYPNALPASFCDRASELWRAALRVMQDAGTFSPTNEPALLRLVLAWVRFEHYSNRCAIEGDVIPSPRTKVPQYNPNAAAMSRAHSEACDLERDLCLSPKHRGSAVKMAAKAQRNGAAARAYLDTTTKNRA